MNTRGHAALEVGLLLHLTADTQIYCDATGPHPPALVLGTEPADCVISTANIDVEPADLVSADRLLHAVSTYRDQIAGRVDRLAT